MADEAVELDLVVTNGLEEGFLADGNGAGCDGCVGDVAALGADDSDLPLGLDGVGETDAAADDRAVAQGLEGDVNLVLDRGGGLANFGCSEDTATPLSAFHPCAFLVMGSELTAWHQQETTACA